MARTTATQVKNIIDTDISPGAIDTFINSANQVVTSVLGSDTTITEELKQNIEMWLAAHFIASTREQQIQKISGDIGVTYQGKTGMGLESTLYGQQVLVMDTTGKIADAITRKNVSFIAVKS